MPAIRLSASHLPARLAARLAILSSAALLAAPAWAQLGPPPADMDGDGVVTRAEFDLQAAERFDSADADFDGALSRDEMRAAREARRTAREAARFDRLDADGDGAVSRAEFEAAASARREQAQQRREAQAERRLERFDADGDGRLSNAERTAARDAARARYEARREARRKARQSGQDNVQESARPGDRRARPRLDGDGDGVVTRGEYIAATDALFTRLDRNGDGVLSQGEGRRESRGGGRRGR